MQPSKVWFMIGVKS